ncbi:response regulator [Ferruginibacter paludis]|uniref:response regulator n=1 Tax=Ferruginibacter paludis TaxID=1310417 RepID=UPI0025B5DC9B|nr:response regulator [Ferruginibacter paludis]MDN3659483.1 response regulator [Ferruginibacter paludis]
MKKILIIEDNTAIRENTAELLELNRFSVLTAENGQAGFELAKISVPDIILCDMMMPDTDGRQFLKLVKEDVITANIPLVFFSAGSLAPEIQEQLVTGKDGYLKKPFTEEGLLDAVKKASIIPHVNSIAHS